MPLIGGYVADAHLGRYKTIHIAIIIGIVAHIILVAASAPTVIVHKTGATAAFIIGLLTLCVGEFLNSGSNMRLVKTNFCDRYWFLQGQHLSSTCRAEHRSSYACRDAPYWRESDRRSLCNQLQNVSFERSSPKFRS
jgi:hypothetical protein